MGAKDRIVVPVGDDVGEDMSLGEEVGEIVPVAKEVRAHVPGGQYNWRKCPDV